LIFCGFAASGFSKWFYYKVIRKRSDFALSAELPATQPANRDSAQPSAGLGNDSD
jgi:hypothetical protein